MHAIYRFHGDFIRHTNLVSLDFLDRLIDLFIANAGIFIIF